MRAWALAIVLLVFVCWTQAGADMTVRPDTSATGVAGTSPRRIGAAYPHIAIVELDSVTTVLNQYTGETPNDSSYADTIGVARDWDGDGVVDSSGVGEWTPIEITVVEYCGIGPDTLWLRGISESGATLWERRFIPPTGLTRHCWSFDPIMGYANRLVAFAGRANQPSIDDWTVTAYCVKVN